MTDTPTDDAGGQQLPECFGPPPSDLHFPLYGLSDTFTGERFLFQWERLFGMDRPAPNPVAWVALVHRSDTRLLEVITFGKQPWTTFGQHESKVDLTSVAYQALFDHLQLVVTKMPLGEVRSKYQTEQLQVIQRLADDLSAPEWQPLSLVVAGVAKDALVYRQGGAWAAVVDLDEHLALGMRGIGIEPDENELVVVEDLGRYPSQLAARADEFRTSEDDEEPVTLAEAEKGLVYALAGVSRIADILNDVLKHQDESHKYAHQLSELEILGVLVGSYASRLADHYRVALDRPFVRDSRDSKALREARLSAGMSLGQLAEASGVDVERLGKAEGSDATVELTGEEWLRVTVVFEGHTLAELEDRQTAKGPVKWLTEHGKMLDSARHLVAYYFDDAGGEDR